MGIAAVLDNVDFSTRNIGRITRYGDPVPVESIQITTDAEHALNDGDVLEVSYYPAHCTQTGVTWHVNTGSHYASVDPVTGSVHVHGDGWISVTATSVSNPEVSVTKEFTVDLLTPVLPDTQLAYIGTELNGNFVDTEVASDHVTEIRFKARTVGSDVPVYAVRATGNSGRFSLTGSQLMYTAVDARGKYSYSVACASNISVTGSEPLEARIAYRNGASLGITVDAPAGTSVATTNAYNMQTKELNNGSIWLFNAHDMSSETESWLAPDSGKKVHIYYIEMRLDDGSLVKLVPVLHNDVPAFTNQATGEYFYMNGTRTGTRTNGTINKFYYSVDGIEDIEYDPPGQDVDLAYIGTECNGNYVDTGIISDNVVRVKYKAYLSSISEIGIWAVRKSAADGVFSAFRAWHGGTHVVSYVDSRGRFPLYNLSTIVSNPIDDLVFENEIRYSEQWQHPNVTILSPAQGASANYDSSYNHHRRELNNGSIWLFNMHDMTHHTGSWMNVHPGAHTKIYYFEVELADGTVIRLEPVLHDGIPMFTNKDRGTYYTMRGTRTANVINNDVNQFYYSVDGLAELPYEP